MGLTEEQIAKAEEGVKDGLTLHETSIENLKTDAGDYPVVVGIVVENWTVWEMLAPVTTIETGQVSHTPVTVQPGEREAMVTHKGIGVSGSWGTVSWLIKPPEGSKRVVLTWDVPDTESNPAKVNELAVGLSLKGKIHPNPRWSLWLRKNKGGKGNDIRFRRKNYDDVIEPDVYAEGNILLHAIMGSDEKPTIKIEVRPQSYQYLAPTLK